MNSLRKPVYEYGSPHYIPGTSLRERIILPKPSCPYQSRLSPHCWEALCTELDRFLRTSYLSLTRAQLLVLLMDTFPPEVFQESDHQSLRTGSSCTGLSQTPVFTELRAYLEQEEDRFLLDHYPERLVMDQIGYKPKYAQLIRSKLLAEGVVQTQIDDAEQEFRLLFLQQCSRFRPGKTRRARPIRQQVLDLVDTTVLQYTQLTPHAAFDECMVSSADTRSEHPEVYQELPNRSTQQHALLDTASLQQPEWVQVLMDSLDVALALSYRKRSRFEVILKLYARIRLRTEDLLNICPAAPVEEAAACIRSMEEDGVPYRLKEDLELLAPLAHFLNTFGGEPTQEDSLRRWASNHINELIVRLNEGPRPYPTMDRPSLRNALHLFFLLKETGQIKL